MFFGNIFALGPALWFFNLHTKSIYLLEFFLYFATPNLIWCPCSFSIVCHGLFHFFVCF